MKAPLLGRVSLAVLLALPTTTAAFGEVPAGPLAAAPFELVPDSAATASPEPPRQPEPPSIFRMLRLKLGRAKRPEVEDQEVEAFPADNSAMAPSFDAGDPPAPAVEGFALYPAVPAVQPGVVPGAPKAPPADARLPRARPAEIAAAALEPPRADLVHSAYLRARQPQVVRQAVLSDPLADTASVVTIATAVPAFALTPVSAVPQAAPSVPPPAPEAAANVVLAAAAPPRSGGQPDPVPDSLPSGTVASTVPSAADEPAPPTAAEPAPPADEPTPPAVAAAAPPAAEPAPPGAEPALPVAEIAPAADPEPSDAAPPADAEVAARETAEAPPGPSPETGIVTAADRELPPNRLVQLLQNLQDQIAQGSTQAFAEQRSMLDRIDAAFASKPPATWQEPGNAAALVTYVLSGGRPDVLRQVLQSSPPPALDEGLMRGALAYVEGHPDKAKELLGSIDARTFPASMGSQLAIAQAALVVADDAKRAADLLDLARLLSPGTLAEEAALRREIFVVAQLQNVDKFRSLSRQYFQRFRNSPYAGNFRERFAAALTRMTFLDDPAQLPRLDGILAELQPDARRALFLIIARAGAVQGKTKVGRFAADRAFATAQAGSASEAQALLYRAAVSVVDPKELDTTLADLKRIDPRLLETSDKQLLAVVASTAEVIRTASAPRTVRLETNVEPAAADAPADSPAIKRAQDIIEVADNLLNGKTL